MQAPQTDGRWRSWLGLVLVLALMMRAGWGLMQPVDDAHLMVLPDQWEYLELGRNLLREGTLSFVDRDFDQRIYAFRTPAYPALIAACGGNLRAVRLVQALLDSSTVLAAFVLARRWLRARAALWSAGIVAVNPFLIYFSGLILTETLFIAMLAWAMVLMTRPGWGMLLLGGLVLALSALVRPSAIPLPAILGFVALWQNSRERGTYQWSRPLAGAGVLAGLTLLVLVPWGWRNYRVLGQWIWTTTNGGITAYDGLNPLATGASNQAHIRQMPQLRAMDEVERSQYLARQARAYAREHPWRAVELAGIKILRTWSPVPLSSEFGGRWLYVAVALLYSIPLDLLVVWGLLSGRISRWGKVFLLAPAVYFTAVHAISVGSLRYRIPAEVPMAVIATAGIARLSNDQASMTSK